jgi:hypothetical protein
VIYDVAAAKGAAVMDMRRFGPYAAAAASPLSLMNSGHRPIHPITKGHAWYAAAITEAASIA